MKKRDNKNEYLEINLATYLKVIFSGKKIIASVVVFFVVASLTFVLLKPKAYEVSTLIEVGAIEGVPLEDPTVLSYGVARNLFDNSKFKIRSEAVGGRMVENIIKTTNAEKARLTLEAINSVILKKHSEELALSKTLLEANLARAEEELIFLKNRKGYNEGIFELNSVIFSFKNKLARLETTRVVKEPAWIRDTIIVQLILGSVASVLAGFLIGVLLVFFRHWWKNNMR